MKTGTSPLEQRETMMPVVMQNLVVEMSPVS